MRKKSHIRLAKYLVTWNTSGNMTKYRKSFYLGSILPDLNPGMIAMPHEYDGTYEGICQKMDHLTRFDFKENSQGEFWRKLGVILHYIADYFTFPHNEIFPGTLKEHCVYEGNLKHTLVEYLNKKEAREIALEQEKEAMHHENVQELWEYLKEQHREYVQQSHSIEEDCRWIVTVCARVFHSLLYLAEQRVMSCGEVSYAAAV